MAGTIDNTEINSFTKLIYRASRGTVLCNLDSTSFKVKDLDGKEFTRAVFVLVFQAGSYLVDRMTKICDGFQCRRFPIPRDGHGSPEEFGQVMAELKTNILKVHALVFETKRQMRDYLKEIQKLPLGSEVSMTSLQMQFIKHEKAIYTILNKMHRHRSISYGYLWSHLGKDQFLEAFYGPDSEQGIIDLPEDNARNFKLNLESIPFEKLQPPTYFRLNEFTTVFQTITDTYGVPTYKEVNPSIYACATFPFLFGIMFGDIGHGALVFIIASFLVLGEPWLKKTSMKPILEMRYILLLMGFFSFYCGFMYNDFVSFPLNIWESCYDYKTGEKIKSKPHCIYPAGIDPVWYISKQEITFTNSLKMKLAVIFGVCHMCLGIIQKAANSVYHKRWLDFCFEFIPQIVLLLALFGYMDTIIIKKWVTDYSGNENKAPSIIQTMVAIFLNGGNIVGWEFFPNNKLIHQILLSKSSAMSNVSR